MEKKAILIQELGRGIRRMKAQPGSAAAALAAWGTLLRIQSVDIAEGKLKARKAVLYARDAAGGKSA